MTLEFREPACHSYISLVHIWHNPLLYNQSTQRKRHVIGYFFLIYQQLQLTRCQSHWKERGIPFNESFWWRLCHSFLRSIPIPNNSKLLNWPPSLTWDTSTRLCFEIWDSLSITIDRQLIVLSLVVGLLLLLLLVMTQAQVFTDPLD